MAKKDEAVLTNVGIMIVLTYFLMLIVNAIVLYLAHMFFPMQVVLGTVTNTLGWSLLLSMGALSLIVTFAMPFASVIEKHLRRDLKPHEWMLGYLVINVIGVWLISRFSEQFGLGVSAWYVVVALAVVLDFVQGMVMMQFGKLTGR